MPPVRGPGGRPGVAVRLTSWGRRGGDASPCRVLWGLALPDLVPASAPCAAVGSSWRFPAPARTSPPEGGGGPPGLLVTYGPASFFAPCPLRAPRGPICLRILPSSGNCHRCASTRRLLPATVTRSLLPTVRSVYCSVLWPSGWWGDVLQGLEPCAGHFACSLRAPACCAPHCASSMGLPWRGRPATCQPLQLRLLDCEQFSLSSHCCKGRPQSVLR